MFVACALLLVAPVVATAQEDVDEPLYAAPTGLDRIGRVLAAVEINGRGPFRFIVDTGSNRSAISSRLVTALGLAPEPDATIEVHGVTGSKVVPVVRVAQVRIGEITLANQQLPILSDEVFADADGILGVDGLQGAQIDVDFVADKVTIRRAPRRHAPSGYLVLPARLEKGGLLLVDGRVGNVRARVIVDTGAERSIGNIALQAALQKTVRHETPTEATVTGATPGSVGAIAFKSPVILIGDARLKEVSVTFADLHVFAVWGLVDQPALVVGMDVIGTVDQFVVNYGRKEFQVKPRAPDGVTVRNCNTGACATRLPDRP